jgi:acetamidase/formamidase
MKEIHQPGKHSYVFSPYLEPIATVQPGEEFVIYTKDAFEDQMTNLEQKPTEVLGDYLNPQTGPVYIEGAEPGDTIKVNIIDIQPTRDWAISLFIPYFGGLTSTNATRTLQEPLPERVFLYRIADGWVTHNEKLRFPWRPFLGTIGTAPFMEALSALTPFDHGGNMDVPDVKPGNSIYLPVNVEGALLFAGDCHAGQGQGELCGVALEVAARTTLSAELIKGHKARWPRIESPEEFMVVGSARPMEDAARIAYTELVYWMVEMGWDKWEAYQALTQIGDCYVGNMVDTYYSMVAKIRKEYVFPGS